MAGLKSLVLLAVVPAAAAQTAGPDPAQATLAHLQQTLAKAWVAGDRPALGRILSPDWTTTGPDGRTSTREQVLREVFGSRVHRIHRIEIDEVKVRAYGEAAVVSGRTHGVGEYGGSRYDVRLRFTDVFIRRGDRWQAVASHASLLADEQ